ncbi:DUF6904 family protein [Pedobacter immunditicola]|uniref:DUF6904 family protein n=1 Tax=Pedobacter immunditicola TaxID=3133440 RepID=UPI0030B6F853
MIELIVTRKGTGVQFWGIFNDLNSLYHTLLKLTVDEEEEHGSRHGRDMILYTFMYELRHSYQGTRQKKRQLVADGEDEIVYGFKWLLIDMIFLISACRFNASFAVLSETDQFNLHELEEALKKAVREYDSKGAAAIEKFVGINGVDVSNDLVWQLNQQVCAEFLEMKPDLPRLRKIPELLNQTFKHSPTYSYMLAKINKIARTIGCTSDEIEYLMPEKIVW